MNMWFTIVSNGRCTGVVWKFPGLICYSSSKAAVITITELWAEEFKESGPSILMRGPWDRAEEMLEEAFPWLFGAPTTAFGNGKLYKGFCT